MPEGVGFPFPSLFFYEGRIYGQPEVVRISLPQVATGLLAGLVPSAGISCRPAHVAGGTLRQRGAFHAGCYAQGTLMQRAFRQIPFSFRKTLPAGNQSRIRQKGGNGSWQFFIIQ